LLPCCPPAVAEWLSAAKESLLSEVVSQNGSCSTTGKAQEEARQRLHALSTSASQHGISFAGAALHHVYFCTKVELRGSLLFRALDAARRQHPCVAALLSVPKLSVASLGGGPACELAGLTCLLRRAQRAAHLPGDQRQICEAVLFDNERSWRRYLPRLQALFAPTLRLSFELCDVRVGRPAAVLLPHDGASGEAPEEANRRLFDKAGEFHLFIASFVANETAAASCTAGYAFYRNLLQAAAIGAAAAATPGVAFLFLDVRLYSRAVLAAIEAAMQEEALSFAGLRLQRLELLSEPGTTSENLHCETMLLMLLPL
jgi:hypothetical protein